jgi:hypothetical protein
LVLALMEESWGCLARLGTTHSLGPNTIQTLRKLGLGEEYDSVAETDERGGLFFEWWDGREDKKYGEVGGQTRSFSLSPGFKADRQTIGRYARPTPTTPDQHATALDSSTRSYPPCLPTSTSTLDAV